MNKQKKKLLTKPIPAWPRTVLAQRLEDSRVLLALYGYLRESENIRIKSKLSRDWEAEAAR